MEPGPHERLARSPPRDWAISSSWCGNTRSTPPVWMSNDGPEVRHAHRRALDVPAGPARARSPCPTTARRAWGPSTARSRGRRPCRTRRPRRARRRASRPGSSRASAPVRRPRRDPEEDRAVVGAVGVAARRAASGRASTICGMCSVARGSASGRVIPSASASARNRLGVAVGELAGRDALGRRAADDLVVDVGEVHDPGHAQAAVAQVADEQVGEQERPEVADVGRAVDRRAAAVDPDLAGLERLERPQLAGQRVPQPDRSSLAGRARTRSRRRAPTIVRPAPSSPGEVAGRRLDVDRAPASSPSSAGDRVAHRVEPVARGGAGPR